MNKINWVKLLRHKLTDECDGLNIYLIVRWYSWYSNILVDWTYLLKKFVVFFKTLSVFFTRFLDKNNTSWLFSLGCSTKFHPASDKTIGDSIFLALNWKVGYYINRANISSKYNNTMILYKLTPWILFWWPSILLSLLSLIALPEFL